MLKNAMNIKNELNSIINLHEKMRNSYFWSSPSVAASRRDYEKYNSNDYEFSFENQKIRVLQDTSCSCKNIYYSMKIFIDDKIVNKDIRFIKKIYKSLI
jgi:hypothetical protein